MKFCPECGSIMKYNKEEGTNSCTCGYSDSEKPVGLIKEKVDTTKVREIVVEEKEIQTNPLDKNIECPKCKHKGAYWWLLQTRASDEPETQFFKCEACSHQWRDYR